jgi:cis-3-alkyl-4-acyloxetan-2-one decarboxylase
MPDKQLYPFAEHWHRCASGHRMHYVDEGPREGLTMLMLHGNPTWSFFYRDLIKGLSPKVRCIAPDHMGCGYSDKPQSYPYTLAQHIDNVKGLVAELRLESVVLVVHDWGGAIGMGLAQHLGKTLKGIVLLNTAAFVSDRIPRRIALCRHPKFGSFINRQLNGFARAAITMAMPKGQKMPRQIAKGFLEPYHSVAHRVAIDAFVKDIPLEKNHVSRHTLESIEKSLPNYLHLPRLIFWGEQDFCFNHHFLDRWQRFWPDAEVHRYPQAGHYLLETVSENILSRLHTWLPELSNP